MSMLQCVNSGPDQSWRVMGTAGEVIIDGTSVWLYNKENPKGKDVFERPAACLLRAVVAAHFYEKQRHSVVKCSSKGKNYMLMEHDCWSTGMSASLSSESTWDLKGWQCHSQVTTPRSVTKLRILRMLC